MKIFKSLLSAALILAILLSGASLLKVAAQEAEITSQQRQRIRDNCLSVKTTLNQLHASDALLRVNMGQVYESMSAKLMSGFTSRVASNGYSNDDLALTKRDYDSTLNNFRSDYKAYEEQLSSAINIDCSKQPTSFYDAVVLARTQRNQVHADVIDLNQYLDQYQSAVNQFETDNQASIDGAAH